MALDMDKPLDEMTREELLELKRIKSYGQQPAAPAAPVQAQPPSVPSPEIQQTKQQAPIPAAEPPQSPGMMSRAYDALAPIIPFSGRGLSFAGDGVTSRIVRGGHQAMKAVDKFLAPDGGAPPEEQPKFGQPGFPTRVAANAARGTARAIKGIPEFLGAELPARLAAGAMEPGTSAGGGSRSPDALDVAGNVVRGAFYDAPRAAAEMVVDPLARLAADYTPLPGHGFVENATEQFARNPTGIIEQGYFPAVMLKHGLAPGKGRAGPGVRYFTAPVEAAAGLAKRGVSAVPGAAGAAIRGMTADLGGPQVFDAAGEMARGAFPTFAAGAEGMFDAFRRRRGGQPVTPIPVTGSMDQIPEGTGPRPGWPSYLEAWGMNDPHPITERMATPIEEFDSHFPPDAPDAPDRMALVPDRIPDPPIESFPEDAVWEQEGLRPRPPAEFGPPDPGIASPVPYSRRMPGPRTEIDPDYHQDTMPSQPIAETVPREGASSAPRRRFPWESERPPDRTWRSGNQGQMQMQPAAKPAPAPKRQAPVKQKAAPPPAPIQPPPQEPLMSGQTEPGEWSAPERPAESQVNSGGKRSLKKEKPQLSREIPIREQAKQDAQAGAARSTRIGDADFTPEERAIYDKAFDYHTKNKSSKPTSAPPEPPFPEAPAQTGAQSDQKLHLWGAQAFRAFVKTGQVPKKFARLKGTPAFDQGWSSAESKAGRPK